MRKRQVVALIGVALAGIAAAQTRPRPAAPDDDVVVIGHPYDIVVNGRAPRCRRLASDPQDLVDLTPAATGHRQTIERDPAGRWALMADDYPVTGPVAWQRAAQRMDRYVFRTPAHGEALCIGTRDLAAPGEAQLRRAMDARPFWGKYMLLTGLVAARQAGRVDMWIAAGATDHRPRAEDDLSRDIVAGGFKPVPITGDFRGRQVSFLIGPIPCLASEISYGIQLQGRGDVWLANPRFVEVPEASLSPTMKARPHGEAMLRTNPICRHAREGWPLWEQQGNRFVPAPDSDIVPTNALYERVSPVTLPAPHAATEPELYRQISSGEIKVPGLIEF